MLKNKNSTIIPTDENRVITLLNRISEIDTKRFRLLEEKHRCQKEIIEIKLKPFKIGDEVFCEVPCGRTKKIQKCIIGVGDDDYGSVSVYVRPYKKDGTLSERHFYISEDADYSRVFHP